MSRIPESIGRFFFSKKSLVFYVISLVVFGVSYIFHDIHKDETGETFAWLVVFYTVGFGITGSLFASFLSAFFLKPDFKDMHPDIMPVIQSSTRGYLQSFYEANHDLYALLKEGIRKCYDDCDEIRDAEWAQWLSSTPSKGCVYLLGTANSEWTKGKNSKCLHVLRDLLQNKECTVFVYFLNPAPEQGINHAELREEYDSQTLNTRERIKIGLKAFIEFRNGLVQTAQQRLRLLLYNETPSQSIMANGVSVYIKSYLLSASNKQSPGVYFELRSLPTPWKPSDATRDIVGEYLFPYFEHLRRIEQKWEKDIDEYPDILAALHNPGETGE